MNYRVDILSNYVPIGVIPVTSCSVKFDANAKIKRGASITANMERVKLSVPSFEKMSDRISPVIIDDSGAEHRLGIFMVIADPATYSSAYNSTNMELYDESYIMAQSAFDSRHYFQAGTPYADVFSAILTESGLMRQMIDASTAELAIDREFAVGDNVLDSLNALLEESGYEQLFINSEGYARCALKSSTYTPNFVYRSGEKSRIRGAMTSGTDIYGIPNVFVGMVSNPDQALMTYTVENHDMSSELSIERRGYKLTKVFSLDSAATIDELKTYIDGLFNDSLMAVETITFETDIETGHEYKDVLQIEHENISGLYLEKQWSITFGTGGSMSHTAEKKVFV